jgi:hypothetical protein
MPRDAAVDASTDGAVSDASLTDENDAGAESLADSDVAPELPDCLRALFAACPLDGACKHDTSEDPVVKECFASGVSVRIEQLTTCAPSKSDKRTSTTEVRMADGTLCYTRTSSCLCGYACETGNNVWTDANGVVVGTSGYTWTSLSYTCGDKVVASCVGSTHCRDTIRMASAPSTCAQGSCP